MASAQLLRETVTLVGCQRQLTIEACLVFRELGGRRGERGIVPLLRVAQGGLGVGKLRRQLRFAPRQAVDIGTGEFVGPAHILEVGAGVVQSMDETVTLARALRQLVIEAGLALREFGSRRSQRHFMLLLRLLTCGLGVGKLRRERRLRAASGARRRQRPLGGLAVPARGRRQCRSTAARGGRDRRRSAVSSRSNCAWRSASSVAAAASAASWRWCASRRADSAIGNSLLRLSQLTLEGVAIRLHVGKLRRELRFAFGQTLDVGSGRSVVLPRLLEGGIGVASTAARGDRDRLRSR